MTIQWEDAEFDDRPVHGPACPGPESHRWRLTIDGDGGFGLGSGCSDCDPWFPIETLTAEIAGTLTFEHEHSGGPCPNAVRFLPCDCNYWWRFTPEMEA